MTPIPFRPKLVSEPKPKNEFAILGSAERSALADINALVARINRALGGPYSTLDSIDMASWQARELADAANALDRAIRRARQSQRRDA